MKVRFLKHRALIAMNRNNHYREIQMFKAALKRKDPVTFAAVEAKIAQPTAPKLSPFVVARKKDDVVVGEFETQAEADECIEKARKGKKAALYIMELVEA
jgi:adenine/guanine phosphoribosyltransferase-like PRPP-binding protein